ncbi:SDR family NAD(P)-dependent oxidoreductase [Saccharothrix carnea]|nr:SDR family NAD(P)-dependent oxidoreductase [Saccharothrix carnea]
MSGVVIIGAGPGIGLSVARRFAREGWSVAVVARSEVKLTAVAESLAGVPVFARAADSTDETALRSALDAVSERIGVPDVVVYNAAVIRADLPGELSVAGHQDAWAVNVVGAITAAAHVAPAMARRGSGSFIITGGMPEPKPAYVSLSLGKAGVRALVGLLDEQYGPAGVHVATVTVDGPVAPGTAFDPDDIAEHYWRLHTQPRHRWEREVVHSTHGRARAAEEAGADSIVADLVGAWQTAFDDRRWSDIVSLFAEDAVFQGLTPSLLVGPAEISAYYHAVPNGFRATAKVLHATALGDGIVAGFADATFTTPTSEPRPIRLSIIAQRIADRWLIRQYHAAALS